MALVFLHKICDGRLQKKIVMGMMLMVLRYPEASDGSYENRVLVNDLIYQCYSSQPFHIFSRR
jgi:hypothetical protein